MADDTKVKDLSVYPSAVAQWVFRRPHRIPADVLAWTRTNGRGRSPVDQGLPWLNFQLIDLLERRLAAGACRVFEWGSGGSTVFYGRRAADVVTVEHDGHWSGLVRDALRDQGLERVELLHVPAGPGPAPVRAEPPLRAEKLNRFGAYIARIEQSGGPFDIVQVDGKARLECAAAARSHLAPGGWLVVDDVDVPGRLRNLLRLLPQEQWHILRTLGPGPASGRRLITSAVVARRR
jgi:hypothetical protein